MSSPRTRRVVRGVVAGIVLAVGVRVPVLCAQTEPALQSANQPATESNGAAANSQPAPATVPRRAPLTTRDALQMYRDKRYQDAVDETLAEIQATPRNLDSYVVLGWSLLALGRYKDALDWGTRALNLSPYDERVIEIIGEANFRLGNNDAAMKYFEEYVRLSPGVNDRLIDDVYYFIGEIYVQKGDWNHADISFSTAIHFQPNDPLYWTRLGYVRENLKEYPQALADYTRALAINPNYQDAIVGRNRVQSILGSG